MLGPGRRSGEGHQERLAPPRLSVSCRLRKETIAAMRCNGQDAPKAVIRRRIPVSIQARLVRHSGTHPCALLRWFPGKIACDQRSPDLRATRSEEETMSVVAVWSDLVKLCLTSVSRECIVKRCSQRWREVSVVFAIDPEHRRRCAPPKLPRSINQQIRPPDPEFRQPNPVFCHALPASAALVASYLAQQSAQ